ncbi:MAG: hypothetical protein U1F11_00325 [Steroidobacteraceae bacterium]
MGRLIVLILVAGLIAWLALKQLRGESAVARDAAQAAGVEVRADATPRETAEAVGRAVEQQVQASKQRVDDATE